jgi:hypothetical protein
MDCTVKTAAAFLYLYLNRWLTRGNLLMRRMPRSLDNRADDIQEERDDMEVTMLKKTR